MFSRPKFALIMPHIFYLFTCFFHLFLFLKQALVLKMSEKLSPSDIQVSFADDSKISFYVCYVMQNLVVASSEAGL